MFCFSNVPYSRFRSAPTPPRPTHERRGFRTVGNSMRSSFLSNPRGVGQPSSPAATMMISPPLPPPSRAAATKHHHCQRLMSPCSSLSPRRVPPNGRPSHADTTTQCGSSNMRRPKDPSSFSSMDELREYLERGEEQAPFPVQEGSERGKEARASAPFRIPLPTITGIISFMGQVRATGWPPKGLYNIQYHIPC